VNLLLPLLLPAVNPVRLSLIGLFCGVVRSIWLRIIRVVRQELGSVIHALMTRSFGCRTDRRDGALEWRFSLVSLGGAQVRLESALVHLARLLLLPDLLTPSLSFALEKHSSFVETLGVLFSLFSVLKGSFLDSLLLNGW